MKETIEGVHNIMTVECPDDFDSARQHGDITVGHNANCNRENIEMWQDVEEIEMKCPQPFGVMDEEIPHFALPNLAFLPYTLDNQHSTNLLQHCCHCI